MLVHVSPKEEDICETVCSLGFATRAKSICLGGEEPTVCQNLTSFLYISHINKFYKTIKGNYEAWTPIWDTDTTNPRKIRHGDINRHLLMHTFLYNTHQSNH